MEKSENLPCANSPLNISRHSRFIRPQVVLLCFSISFQKGFFSDSYHTYWLESLEHHEDSRDATPRILVARKPISARPRPESSARPKLVSSRDEDHHNKTKVYSKYYNMSHNSRKCIFIHVWHMNAQISLSIRAV